MAIREILQLGNERLYEASETVKANEIGFIRDLVNDLHDTMIEFRRKHGFGRAIAAPQIGIMKRVVYMHMGSPTIFINPGLTFKDGEIIEIWDNCMSFPNLLVKVQRHKRCQIVHRDLEWRLKSDSLEGDISELLQHECDHLDGILATMRAIDNKSFAIK